MDAPISVKTAKINRFLPYWAVFQADVRITMQSWIYRCWVFLTIAAAAGYLVYGLGVRQEARLEVPAHNMISDLLRWTLWGSITLIIVLASGTICSERGNVADAVLCRGISRYQYFMGKWHARVVTILTTYFCMATLSIVASMFMLHGEHLSLTGCLLGLLTVAAVLVLVVTCGVTVSALTTNTVLSIAIVWLVLSGGGILLSFLPAEYPSPDRSLKHLPNILRGMYDAPSLGKLIGASLSLSVIMALFGMVSFSQRDV